MSSTEANGEREVSAFIPVYNVYIDLAEGKWNTFDSIRDFKRAAQHFVTKISDYIGSFIVSKSRELRKGEEPGLHRFEGRILPSGLDNEIVFDKDNVITIGGTPQEGMALDRHVRHFSEDDPKPIYTLDRIYEFLENAAVERKIKVIYFHFEEHGVSEEAVEKMFNLSADEDPEAVGSDVILQRLEQAYRELISDQ